MSDGGSDRDSTANDRDSQEKAERERQVQQRERLLAQQKGFAAQKAERGQKEQGKEKEKENKEKRAEKGRRKDGSPGQGSQEQQAGAEQPRPEDLKAGKEKGFQSPRDGVRLPDISGKRGEHEMDPRAGFDQVRERASKEPPGEPETSPFAGLRPSEKTGKASPSSFDALRRPQDAAGQGGASTFDDLRRPEETGKRDAPPDGFRSLRDGILFPDISGKGRRDDPPAPVDVDRLKDSAASLQAGERMPEEKEKHQAQPDGSARPEDQSQLDKVAGKPEPAREKPQKPEKAGRAQEKPTRKERQTPAGKEKGERLLSPSEAMERYERQRYAQPEMGVGFQFDSRKQISGEVQRWQDSLPEDLRQSLQDSRTVIHLTASASRPGTEAYNQRLSEERGEAVAQEMRALGIRAQIEIHAVGEQAARRADGTPMSLSPPGDHPQERDNAQYRAVLIEIQPFMTQADMEPEVVEGIYRDQERLNDDLVKGEQSFEDNIAPLGEKVRELHKLPENPAAPDPSRDPKKLLFQFGKLALEILSDPKEKAAEMAIGIFLEGPRAKMKEKVAQQRKPAYEAVAQGVARGLDPGFNRPKNWQPQNDAQRALYAEARKAVSKLSEREKDQLRLFLTMHATQHEKTTGYLLPKMEGSSYRSGTLRFFSSDKHYRHE